MAGTGAPVPSDAFADLKVNMENADNFANSTEYSYTNRESPNGNVTSKTVSGLINETESVIATIAADGAQAIVDFNADGDAAISDFNQRGDDAIDDLNQRGDNAIDNIQQQADNIAYSVGFEPVGVFEVGATVANSQQVLSYDGEQYRTDGAGTVTQATPELDPLPWYNVTLQDRKSVARARNTLDVSVIYSTDVVSAIPSYIYSPSQQKSFSVPSDAQGKVIQSVIGSVLTTTDASVYTLKQTGTVYFATAIELSQTPLSLMLGTRIKTDGRDSVGDGGAAEYLMTENPAFSGDFSINGLTATLQLQGQEPIMKFGDIHGAVARWPDLTLDGKTYYTSSVINFASSHQKLGGTGNIYADHALGNIIHISARCVNISGRLVLDSTGDRLIQPYSPFNAAIRVGKFGAAIPTQTKLSDIDVLNNPGDGLYISGDAVTSTFQRFNISRCRGHAVIVDDGSQVGEVLLRGGAVSFSDFVCKNNGGNVVALAPTGQSSYRIDINQFDNTGNGWNETEIGYPVNEAFSLYGQSITLSLNAGDSGDWGSTDLENGALPRYARSGMLDLINIKGPSKSVVITGQRALEVVNAVRVTAAVDGLTIDPIFNGSAITHESTLFFDGGTATATNINLLDERATDIVKSNVNTYQTVNVGDDIRRITNGGDYTVGGNATSATISGGGARISSTVVKLVGEGGVADSVGFLKPGDANIPLYNGEKVILINENSYDITVNNSTASPVDLTPISTNSGGPVVLTQNGTFTGVVVNGRLTEL